MTTFRLPKAFLDQLDEIAASKDINRSDALLAYWKRNATGFTSPYQFSRITRQAVDAALFHKAFLHLSSMVDGASGAIESLLKLVREFSVESRSVVFDTDCFGDCEPTVNDEEWKRLDALSAELFSGIDQVRKSIDIARMTRTDAELKRREAIHKAAELSGASPAIAEIFVSSGISVEDAVRRLSEHPPPKRKAAQGTRTKPDKGKRR